MQRNPEKWHNFHAHGPDHQNIWPNYTAAKSLVNMAKFKYWNSTDISKSHSWGIKSWLHSENACYHSVWNLLSYHLLSKGVWIKIQQPMTLFTVYMGAKLWSLNIKLGTEWRCLRIGCYWEHVELSDRNQQESEKDEWSFMICTSCQLLFGLQLKEGGLDGASGIHDKYIQRFGRKT